MPRNTPLLSVPGMGSECTFGKTRCDQNCIIFFSQLIKGNIPAHLATGSNLDAGSQYVLDILGKGLDRKSVARNGMCEHAAEPRVLFIDPYPVSAKREVQSSGQA